MTQTLPERPGSPDPSSPSGLPQLEAGHLLPFILALAELFIYREPRFLGSRNERIFGELKVEKSLRTGFLQAGQWVNSLASRGRRNVNLPPQTLQCPHKVRIRKSA